MDGSTGPAGDATDPTASLAEFRRRLDEFRAELERRRMSGTQSGRLSTKSPSPGELSGLSDTDLQTAIDFAQKFLDAADLIVSTKDPAAAAGAMMGVFGSLTMGMAKSSTQPDGAATDGSPPDTKLAKGPPSDVSAGTAGSGRRPRRKGKREATTEAPAIPRD